MHRIEYKMPKNLLTVIEVICKSGKLLKLENCLSYTMNLVPNGN